MNYGVPYKGSKNAIANRLLEVMPPAETFYDLFAGGCAMTHAAMLSGKYKRFVANDINPMPVRLFRDAIAGKYHDEKRVITRDQFEMLKDTDPYVAYCWSFGNNGRNYLWNDVTAGFKVRACRMIFADTWQERLRWFRDMIQYWQEQMDELEDRREKKGIREEEIGDLKEYLRLELCRHLKENGLTAADIDRHTGTFMSGHYFSKSQWAFPTRDAYNKMREVMPSLPEYDYWGQDLGELQSLQSLERLESLQSLESLERLQRLQSLESLERLQISSLSYEAVDTTADGVIYCDIPYKGTSRYDEGGFDHEGFYNWVRSQNKVIYISEYTMPDDFVPILEIAKTCQYCSTSNSTKTVERLYVHESKINRVVKTTLF